MEDLREHIENGCSYGQPDGPDDYFKDCDCPEDEDSQGYKIAWLMIIILVNGYLAYNATSWYTITALFIIGSITAYKIARS